jgi:hypothetical protein
MYIVGAEGVSPVESVLKLNKDWAVPARLKEPKFFLGSISRYFAFYPHVAYVTALLARATGLKHFAWTKEVQTAFEDAKQKLANVKTHTTIQQKVDVIFETDTSGTGIGAVLLQVQSATERPIAYYSKTLSNALPRSETIPDSCSFEITHLPGKQNAIADAVPLRPESVLSTPVKFRAV